MRQNAGWWASIGATMAALAGGLGYFWGFTVDDAWIVSRIAHHGATGDGFSFNVDSPATDAVTPLGFAQLLAVLGGVSGLTEPFELFSLARWLGLLSALATVSFLGAALSVRRHEQRTPWRVVLFGGFLALNPPFLAWAGAGLAGPLAGLLLTLGAFWCSERGNGGLVGGLLLGCAAGWRPELAIFSGLVCWGRSSARYRSLLVFCGALGVVAVVRWSVFGSPVPLSAIAKAPHFESGLRYALGTAAFGGPFLAVLALPGAFSLQRESGLGWGWIHLGHLVALVFAGGDWMAFYRLSAPLVPWTLYLVARDFQPRLRCWTGLATGLAGSLVLFVFKGAEANEVLPTRLEWIEQARPLLKDAEVVATVDVGWVGIATDARIVDLAGVTDPTVAHLAGGHTSKWVPPALLAARDVDTWVMRTAQEPAGASVEGLRPVYQVDARLLQGARDFGYQLVGSVGQGSSISYAVLRSVQ